MPNPFGAPEIDVQRVEEKRQADEQFIWLDVREEDEIAQVAIVDERIVVVPLSALAARQLDALPAAVQDQQREIVVFCHHGVRSAQVAVWLAQQGWSNVVSMAGGIDAWKASN
ncbi:MAG: rhodanese-like domain-containing protein [Caldilineaceae bacterium]